MKTFTHKDQVISVEQISSVKQITATEVQIRYLDGSAVLLRNTSSSEVLKKIEAAKHSTDSA